MSAASERAWIAWVGGNASPEPKAVWVDAKLRSGQILTMCRADFLQWRHHGLGSDIVSYRVRALEPGLAEATEPSIMAHTWAAIHDPSLPTRQIKHLKRGSVYDVIGEAEVQVSTNFMGAPFTLGTIRRRGLSEGDKMVVYRDPRSGKLWLRFPDEIADKNRFEDIAPVIAKTNLENESVAEICSESKAETQSDFERAHHIMSLWDRSESVVLDGFAYRTNGVDHVPRLVAR